MKTKHSPTGATGTEIRKPRLFPVFQARARFGWLALCCTLFLTTLGHATTQVTLNSTASGLPSPASNSQSVQSSANAPVQATCDTNATSSTFWSWTDCAATASGRAEVGRLQLSGVGTAAAQMTAPGTVVGAYGNALAHTSWSDSLTINASPQLFGQLGELTATISISGNLLLASEPPGASVYFRVFVRISDSYGADTRLAGGMMIKRMGDGTVQTLPMDGALVGPGLWQTNFQFHFGRTAFLTAWAEVSAEAKAEAISVAEGIKYGEATSDFSHSVVWAGASDVRLAGGAAVNDFTVISDSGYDYFLGTVTNAPVITRIQALPQGLALEWTDLGPRSYTVETTTALPAGSWTPAQGVAWPIHNNSALLPLPAQSPAFFRVKVQ